MKKEKIISTKNKILELTHDTLPASVGLVKEVRNELRADIRRVEHRLNSRIDGVCSKIELVSAEVKQVSAEVKQVSAEVKQVSASVEQVSSRVQEVLVSVHRSQVLMEEQRGENRIVLDGIKNLIERQDRVELDVGVLSGTLKELSVRTRR